MVTTFAAFVLIYKMAKNRTTQDESLKALAERIRFFRKQKGYANYEELAYKKNLPRSQVGRYEKGTVDIRYTSLLKIIHALEVTPAEFFSQQLD